MKPRSLIVVGCVFLLVVAWVAARRVGLFKPRSAVDALAGQAVLDSKLAPLTKIEIVSAGGQTVRLVKAADAWRIASPIDAKADPGAVNRLADALRDLRFDRAVVSQGPDAEGEEITGLGKPAWTIRLAAGAASAQLGVGRAVPGQGGCYLIQGKDAGVVSTDLAKLVGLSAAQFRDKKVLRLDESQIARVTLTTGAGVVDLSRGSDQKWALLAPVSAPADKDAVSKIVRAVADLTAIEFVPGPAKGLEAYGLTGETAQAKVRIEMKAPSPTSAPATGPGSRPAAFNIATLVCSSSSVPCGPSSVRHFVL